MQIDASWTLREEAAPESRVQELEAKLARLGTEKEEQEQCQKEWIANFESYIKKQQKEHREEINRLEAKLSEAEQREPAGNEQLL